MLVEIVVFFDFEDNLFFFKRSWFRGFCFFEFFVVFVIELGNKKFCG